MSNFFSGTTHEWRGDIYPQLLRYRYRVFVEKLGWNVPHDDGMEFDQFDREDTVHVVARDETGELNAYSRLLPTVKPYLLEKVFPQLMDGQSLPRSDETWELSRFTAQDWREDRATRRASFFSPRTIELLRYTVSTAARQGARNLIFVGSPGMVTLGKRADYDIRRIGRPRIVGGHRLQAAVIRV